MSDRRYQTRCRGPHAKLLAYPDPHLRVVHIVCTSHWCDAQTAVFYATTDTPQQVADMTLAEALSHFDTTYGIDDATLATIKADVGGEGSTRGG